MLTSRAPMLENVCIGIGTLTLVGYGLFLPHLSLSQWRKVFGPCLLILWLVSATASALGFAAFSLSLFDPSLPDLLYAVAPPFVLFLNSVAIHMPLAQAGCPKALLVARVLTALCTWPLAHASLLLFGVGQRTGFMVLLALHCSIMDWVPGDWRSRSYEEAQRAVDGGQDQSTGGEGGDECDAVPGQRGPCFEQELGAQVVKSAV